MRSPVQGWNLTRRLAVATIAAGVVLVGMVGAVGVLLQETREAAQRVTVSYYDGGRIAFDYYFEVLDAESAIRAYGATRDQAALTPASRPDGPWRPDATAPIREQLQFDPELISRVAALDAATRRWYDDFAGPAVQRLQAGETLSPEEIRAGEQLFVQVRQTWSDFLGDLRTGRAAALDRLETTMAELFFLVAACALLVVGSLVLLWFLLRAWVTRPVMELAAEARMVEQGDLDHRVSVTGPPDFVRLAEDVESMRRRLVAQIAVAEESAREVAAARAKVEDQAAELQRSNRELEQFAYVASHDLQEPLRKVASFCQLLEKRYAGQLDERADQYIAFAVDGAKRMQRLINDLLEFSRVGRSGTGVHEIDLDDCLRSAVENLAVSLEEAGAEVTSDPLPVIRGEGPLLTQVLQNLIGNAVKFRASGRPPRIRITVRRAGPLWEFACTDNGIGIAPEHAERVFDIFQRLHAKDLYGGTGIGLALCKKIVEYHGGHIWLDTEEAEGTTIRWTLPVRGHGQVTFPDPTTVAGRQTPEVTGGRSPAPDGEPSRVDAHGSLAERI